MSDLIRTAFSERIARIQIYRPDKKNALTQAMYAALADALEAAAGDPKVRVVLLTGADNVFTAGNDIADFLTDFSMQASSPVVRFLHSVAASAKPVVAAVNGPAIGIGVTMLLHCDLAYCGRSARFQLPFVNLGLAPEAGSSLILPQMLGHKTAAGLLMLGEPFDAATALQLGIVNGVVEDDAVLETATEVARKLAAKPPAALRQTKQLMKRWPQQKIGEAMEAEAEVFASLLRAPEAAEALEAFLQRRTPDFSRFE